MIQDPDEIRANIRRFMKLHGLKNDPWCEAAGVSKNTLRNFLRGTTKRAMRQDTVQKLAAAVGTHANNMLGIRHEASPIEDLQVPFMGPLLKPRGLSTDKIIQKPAIHERDAVVTLLEDIRSAQTETNRLLAQLIRELHRDTTKT